MKVSARSRWNVVGLVESASLLNSIVELVKVRNGYVMSRTQNVAQGRPIGCVRGALCHCAGLVLMVQEVCTGRCVVRRTLGSPRFPT